MNSAVLADKIRYVEARLLDWENPSSSKEFQRILEELTLPQASINAAPSIEAALQLCQKLYLAGTFAIASLGPPREFGIDFKYNW